MSRYEIMSEISEKRNRIYEINSEIRETYADYRRNGMSGCCFESDNIAALKAEREACNNRIGALQRMAAAARI